MDITRMECFISVAENGSVTKAARQMHMTQPALSFHLKEMEKELGTPLLERTSKGTTLTAAGRIAAKGFKEILSNYYSLSEQISAAGKSSITPRLTIGYHGPVNWAGVPHFIADFCAANPGVEIVIIHQQWKELAEYLRIGAIDLAFLSTDEFERGAASGLSGIHLFREKTGFHIPVSHPLSAKTSVKTPDILGNSILMNNHPSVSMEVIIDRLRKCGIAENDFRFFDTMEATLALSAAGQGLACLPESFKADISAMSFVIYDEDSAWMDYSLVWDPSVEKEHKTSFVAMALKSPWPYSGV